ncbi:hypothetical protein GCM10010218_62210 [Streptomyces mashuensis]|uniref:Uncharacterized protein n=1 Tax=Streptomyces mashuensis TaxID=33904 RepID=A0A919B9D3_9ACTN|nr:hypothetical protein [Streptomyces mashuensis]GHF72458.1 hypothetical protein GCM10010218_62210 [Streptomyces mashuensis]
MNIDWAALGEVFGVTLVVTVALVGLFTLGIVGTARKPGASATAGGAGALARTGAYAAFALCAAAVGYGISLIVG